jgi:hypothetical protein
MKVTRNLLLRLSLGFFKNDPSEALHLDPIMKDPLFQLWIAMHTQLS